MTDEGDLPDSPSVASYRRYAITGSGVSPLRFPPTPGAAIKSNSYSHDENGVTTELPDLVVAMMEKRLRKMETLKKETDLLPAVNTGGEKTAEKTLLCWGSTLPVCSEIAEMERFRLVQPVILSPFPEEALKQALAGTKKTILVEENALGQLQMLCARHGIPVDHAIHRYDGRPFPLEELRMRVREVA
ncbi:MAG: hypothetical protein LUP93_08075 [Methanomicrobiales archaeon]|nr:hypothetical protein [Methanomicrobiales archaeon]